ncbi:MAG: hypothetical protein JO051_04585 [Acidobacteriaceae bacterium]|nr:hypothetical protein [Acidobacteriaceae bacterium]
MIAELQTEKQRLDQAIEALERLSRKGMVPRRGRPPAWLKKQIAEMALPEERQDTK